MKTLQVALSIFGNPCLDLHRLLQGEWPVQRGDYSDGDVISYQPLLHLTHILHDALLLADFDNRPATSALQSLCHAVLDGFDLAVFRKPNSPFWWGLRYVAMKAAEELSITLVDVTRDEIRELVIGITQAEQPVDSNSH